MAKEEMIEKSSLDNSFEKRNRDIDDRPEDKNSSLSAGSDDKKLAPIVKRENVKVEKEGIFTRIRKSFVSEDMSDILFYAWDEPDKRESFSYTPFSSDCSYFLESL